jgi:glycosyltransferase involved in cell wall biosynthesis
MRISVIMASYLNEYTSGPHKSATNREFKFRRAVNSFLNQTFKDAELIIVSDGCEKTNQITHNEYLNNSSIKLIELQKQPLFSGNVRQTGLNAAVGEIICYLDSDDVFGEYHLQIINTFDDRNFDWCYYDDYIFDGVKKITRSVKPEHCYIGTSSICHTKKCGFKWQDGYGHDWRSIEKILNLKYYKLTTPEYIVCHIHGLKIDV